MSYLKHKPGSIEEIMANQNQKLNDNAYQDMFKKELEKAGTGIGSMSPKEKQDFFNKIDDKYKAKNEEVSKVVPAGSHKMPDGTIMKDKDHKNEEDAYDKDDEKPKSKPKKEEVKEKDLEEAKFTINYDVDSDSGIEMDINASSPKDAAKKFGQALNKIVKQAQARGSRSVLDVSMNGMEKDGNYISDREIDKLNDYASDFIYKEIKETHMGQTKKANNHQKSANGEKEIIKSGAKLKFKEAYKKVKENQTTTDDSTQDRANQGVSLDDNSKDPDIKKPKGKADTGSKPTPVDTSPEIEYKN